MVSLPIYERSDHDFKSTAPSQTTIIKVLVLVSVFGWVFFGIISILYINGRGRAGRWVPEWYLDSQRSLWNKATVGAWWAAVVVLWPLILPVLVVRKGYRGLSRRFRGRQEQHRKDEQQRKEEQRKDES